MRLFVSYRRSDSEDISGRLAERLTATPGIRDVFIDVDGIKPGDQFVDKIRGAIDRCDAVLVVVGRDWIGHRTGGAGGRIGDPDDFVRREVAMSLASGRRVLPVFVHAATMPPGDMLPEDVRPLVHLNGISVRHESFELDLERLIDAIFERPRGGSLVRYFRRRPILALALKSLGGVVLAIVLLVLLASVHHAVADRALAETLGEDGVWLLIIAFPVAGALLPLLRGRG